MGFDLLSTHIKTIFFAEFSQRQHRWSVFQELDRDEHVQIFHVDCGLLGCVHRRNRREHRRGTSRHFDCFQFFSLIDATAVNTVVGRRDTLTVSNSSGDISILLIICTDAPESTLNFFSSGLPVDVDATLICIFGLKNVASFTKYVPRFFLTTSWPIVKLLFWHHLLPTACCLDLCRQKWACWDCDDISDHPG